MEPSSRGGTNVPPRVPSGVSPAAFIPAALIVAALFLPVRAPAIPAAESALSGVVVNIRDFGAIGDGADHPVSEWINSGRLRNLRAIQKLHPFVDDLRWSIDEVAFEQAKRALPASGGTIYFPPGHYVAGRHGWRVWRDHVRILGDGPAATILSTAPHVPEGLVLAPYRHIGWREGASREIPYTATSGERGSTTLQLLSADSVTAFQPGERVFIRNGANRFDQDYGEFNEIESVSPDGGVRFKFPFARDYTLNRFNWAGETAKEFTMPAPGGTAKVEVKTGEGHFLPRAGATVTAGNSIFRVEKVVNATLHLSNPGRSNEPPGSIIPAGTKIGKARTVIKVTRTASHIRVENLQVIGRRKALNLSNSYDVAFTNCTFRRDARTSSFTGGLTIDGDGGRFARFDRCVIIAEPAAGMQFARSFGNVVFSECQFVNANVAFTEFNFDCTVTNCTFEITGSSDLTNVIIAGKSCGDLRLVDNRIRAVGVKTIFDTYSDIHSQKHGSEGGVLVRGNTIETTPDVRVFTFPRSPHVELADNHVTELTALKTSSGVETSE